MKHKRDSWQTWENYAQVAARVGQWQAAVRALGQVLALSSGQRLDLATLAALVGQVEAARSGAAPPADGQQPAEQQPAEQRGPQQSDAAVAAEGAAPAADPAATGGEAPSGLAELAAALGELSTSGGTGGGADPADAAAQAEAVAQAEARAAAVLEQAVGGLLKQVAATASGDSAFWEVYARCAGWRLGAAQATWLPACLPCPCCICTPAAPARDETPSALHAERKRAAASGLPAHL